jgi:hypothetical protein
MKKSMALMLILLSIMGNLCAQLPGKQPRHQFSISLDNGNNVRIELDELDDFVKLVNIDSILGRLVNDLDQIKDTIGNPQYSTTINYAVDEKKGNKLSFYQHIPDRSDFIFANNEVSALKLNQDTVIITGQSLHVVKDKKNHAQMVNRTYKLSFYLNYLKDLRSYQNGILQTAFLQMKQDIEKQRKKMKAKEDMKGNYSIAGQRVSGAVSSKATASDFLSPYAGVSLQNYTSYFVPSFNLGAVVTFNRKLLYRHEFGLIWEPFYFFEKDSKGKIQALRNEFLTLTYGYGLLKGQDPKKNISMTFVISFSYLIKRKGDYFEPQSFRIGGGKLVLFSGKTSIEPLFYFHDFFRGVSPGLKLTQTF